MNGKNRKQQNATDEPEHRADSWERFERAVDVALKTPPIRKETPKTKRKPKTKKPAK